jgi:hypothetical protein
LSCAQIGLYSARDTRLPKVARAVAGSASKPDLEHQLRKLSSRSSRLHGALGLGLLGVALGALNNVGELIERTRAVAYWNEVLLRRP